MFAGRNRLRRHDASRRTLSAPETGTNIIKSFAELEATVLKILFYIATADFLQISFTTSATSQNFLHHLQRDFPSIELMNVIAFYSSQVLT